MTAAQKTDAVYTKLANHFDELIDESTRAECFPVMFVRILTLNQFYPSNSAFLTEQYETFNR